MNYWDYTIGAYLDVSITGGAQWRRIDNREMTYRAIDAMHCTLHRGRLVPGMKMCVLGHFVYYIDRDPTRDMLIVTQSRWQALLSSVTVPLSYWWDGLRIKAIKTWRIWTENGRH